MKKTWEKEGGVSSKWQVEYERSPNSSSTNLCVLRLRPITNFVFKVLVFFFSRFFFFTFKWEIQKQEQNQYSNQY